ncbi:MAG: hypothetical protein H7Y60_12335 [Rhodospirillaceae bacterium]|nr:hypothetical protein [Rhodospirillales bacterium]
MNDAIATSELRRLLQRQAQQLASNTPAEGQTLTGGQRIMVLTAALDRLDAMRAELLAQRQAAIAVDPALQTLVRIDRGEAEVPQTEEIADLANGPQ